MTTIEIQKMFVDYEASILKSEVENFKNYIIETSELLDQLNRNFEIEIENKLRQFPNNANSIIEEYQENHHQYKEFFPSINFSSSLTASYSFFERTLKGYCEIFYTDVSDDLKVDDLGGGNYIERSKMYLKKVIKIDLTSLDADWQEITKYQKMRNILTHSTPSIMSDRSKPLNKQPLYSFVISNNHSIKLDPNTGAIVLVDKQILLDFLDLVYKFLDGVLTLLKAKLQ